jgi:excisionase family DNA binding protein
MNISSTSDTLGQKTTPTPALSATRPATPAALAVTGQAQLGHSGPNGYTPVRLAYTVEEAAEALHVSTKTIRRLLDRGILTASKALRKKLIPRSQIEGFLKATCDAPKSIL